MTEKDFVVAWLIAFQAGGNTYKSMESYANLVNQAQNIWKMLESLND